MQLEESIRFVYVKAWVMVSARDGASGIEYAIVAAMCAAVIMVFAMVSPVLPCLGGELSGP